MLSLQATHQFIMRNLKQGDNLKKGLLGHHQDIFEDVVTELRKTDSAKRWECLAGNVHARNLWMRALGGHLCDLLEANAPDFIPDQPLYFLSVMNRQTLRTLKEWDEDQLVDGEVNQLNTFSNIKLAYQNLLWKPINCIGMIEPAVYVSCMSMFGMAPVYAYHFHAICWSISEAKLNDICEYIRSRIRALLPYATAAHFRRIKGGDLLQMLWYMTKVPNKQHQLWQRPSGSLRQFKRQINAVNAVRIYSDLRDVPLEKLLICKGEGELLQRQLLKDVERWRSKALPRYRTF